MDSRVAVAFERLERAEVGLCRRLNRTSARSSVAVLFGAVSRLGDGWLWYGLMVALPLLYGSEGMLAAAHMAITGAAGVLVYKCIKERAVRERPFITHAAIRCAAAPLDRYSFPSGHTLHAVCFAAVASSYFPEWTPALAAFTALVALSRVVLGLHYPTDVAAGAVLGGALAAASLSAAPLLVG